MLEQGKAYRRWEIASGRCGSRRRPHIRGSAGIVAVGEAEPIFGDARIAIWLGVIGAGGNVTVALLPMYRADLGLSTGAVTGLFGLYALSLIPALPIGGALADRFGPGLLLLPISLATIATSATFAAGGDNLALLVVGRLLQGLVSGAAFTAGTALLSRTGAQQGRGGRRTAVAMTAGFAAGALVGGFAGQWAPDPSALPYLIHAVAVMAAAAFALIEVRAWPVPTANLARESGRRGGTLLRRDARREAAYFLAPCAVCIYGFPAIAINAVPALVGVPGPPVAGTGVLSAMTLGSGAAVAGLQRILGRWTAATSACCGMAGILLITVSTIDSISPVVLLLAAVMLGSGGGLALAHVLVRLPTMSMPGRIGTVSAVFYMVAYVGFGAPFVLAELGRATSAWLPFLIAASVTAALLIHQLRAPYGDAPPAPQMGGTAEVELG